MYYSNDYLCHYGVLGMKWGQHLFGKSSSSGKTSARKQARAQRKADIAEGKKYATYTQKQMNKANMIKSPIIGGVMGGVYSGMAASAIGQMAVLSLPAAPIAIGGAALGAVAFGVAAKRSADNVYGDIGAAARRGANYASDNMGYVKQIQDKADEYNIANRVKMV